MANLLQNKKNYLKKGGDKDKYMKQMFETHKHLFEYPKLIKNSPVKKIEITDEGVIFTVRKGNKSIMVCCDNRDIYSIPLTYLNLSQISASEENENNMILKIIKPGDVVFDIGANIGWYTLLILYEKKGTSVYSFEPIKSSYEYMVKNLKLNNYTAAKAYCFGFSNQNKKVKFYFDIEVATASSMANLREAGCTIREECQVRRMDDFVPRLRLKKLDFIKCDVEGSEKLVFEGGIETIKKYKPIIFSEMLRKWSKKFNYHPNDIIGLLHGLDYECYVISKNKIRKFGQVKESTKETMYLFFHKTKHKKIIEKFIK
ncbi:MAG: FkbM family methyltransferase [Patescibacteria group bacterium]